ncbi:MAG: hypothetical protein KDA87_25455 [Planctomycetales bacterium]|nr:hypothetical protein [Planctomycetales bacterium]
MLTQLLILAAIAAPPVTVPGTIGFACYGALTLHRDDVVEKVEPIRADAAIWWRQATMDANESGTPPTPA